MDTNIDKSYLYRQCVEYNLERECNTDKGLHNGNVNILSRIWWTVNSKRIDIERNYQHNRASELFDRSYHRQDSENLLAIQSFHSPLPTKASSRSRVPYKVVVLSNQLEILQINLPCTMVKLTYTGLEKSSISLWFLFISFVIVNYKSQRHDSMKSSTMRKNHKLLPLGWVWRVQTKRTNNKAVFFH